MLMTYVSSRLCGPQAGQKGFTMIEVLVTMLVIAVGLMGHAGLLTTTFRHNQSAYLRSEATILAHEVVECMRANRAVAMLGSYNIAVGSIPSGGSVAGGDLTYWKANLSSSLPAGDGSVTVDLQGNVTIVVQWDDNRDGVPLGLTTQTTL